MKKAPAAPKQIAVRLPAELVEQLERYIAERNTREPGLALTQSDAVRVLLTQALAAAKK